MAIVEWTDPAEVEAFLHARGSGWIFKHSTKCPASFDAQGEVERYEASGPGEAIFRIRVIESRDASNAVAGALCIRHESPQAILVRDGRAVWVASHGDIKAESLRRAAEGTASLA